MNQNDHSVNFDNWNRLAILYSALENMLNLELNQDRKHNKVNVGYNAVSTEQNSGHEYLKQLL